MRPNNQARYDDWRSPSARAGFIDRSAGDPRAGKPVDVEPQREGSVRGRTTVAGRGGHEGARDGLCGGHGGRFGSRRAAAVCLGEVINVQGGQSWMEQRESLDKNLYSIYIL